MREHLVADHEQSVRLEAERELTADDAPPRVLLNEPDGALLAVGVVRDEDEVRFDEPALAQRLACVRFGCGRIGHRPWRRAREQLAISVCRRTEQNGAKTDDQSRQQPHREI